MANELNYTARLSITEAKKSALELQKIFKEVGISPASNDNYKTSQLALQDALRRSRLELQELKKTQQEYKNQQAESGAATAELTRKIAENRLEQQQLIAATRSARTANIAVSGSYKEAQQQLTALGNRIRGVEGGFNNLGKVQQARIKEYNELNNKIKAFDAQMGNNQRNVGNYKSALSGVKGELIGMIAQYASLAAIIGVVGKTFNQSLKSDSVRTSLEFTFGSVDLADAKLKQLLETANRLGVDYNALTSSYKSFAGAVIASNFDFQTGEKIFNAVAGAAAKLKLSSEDTEGALRALQQMISKGNVQAEELRGQLGERIPGAFSIAARAMNVTEAELNKMLQKGEVLAADLLPKLATELEKTFDTNSTERVEGLAAAWGRLTNVFSGTVAESGRITKFFTALIDGVGEASKAIANMVNSSSWNEFVARLFVNDNGKTGDNIRSITDAVEKSQKVINKSYNVDANSGAKTILTTYEEIKIAYEKASKALTVFKKGVADGTLVEKGANTIKSLSTTVDVLNSQMNRLKNNLPSNSGKPPVKSQKQIEEEESAAKKAQRIRDKNQRELESATDRQIKLQEKIQEAIQKSNIKNLSAYDEDVANVRKYYQDLRDEAIKFNNDPKNKGKRVDVGGLAKPENIAIKSIDFKYETAAIVKQFEVQKKLFADYENYKTSFGKEQADKRFGDQSSLNQKLINELTQQNNDLASKAAISGLSENEKKRFEEIAKLLGASKDIELKKYEEAYNAAKTYEQKVLEINKDYTDKAIALRSKVGKNATVEQKKELDAQIGVLNEKWQSELEGEKQTAYQKTEIYRTQAAQVLELTKQQVKDQIEILKTLLDDKNIPKEVKSKIEGEINKLEFALKVGIDQNNLNTINAQIDLIKRKLSAKDENGNTLITQEEFERLKKELDDLIGKKNELEGNSGTAKSDFAKGLAENFKYLNGTASEVLTGISTDLGQVSGSFGELSNALGGVNTEAGYTLDTIGQLVGVASDAAGAAASFASGDIIGGVTKTIKAISGIFSIGKKVKEMNAAARKEVEDFYANAIAGEKAYQDKLRERELQTIRQNKLVLQGIRDEIALRKEQTSDYAKETAEIMAKLQGQSYVSAETYTHGTWFRKAKVDKTYTSLAGKSFEELSSLLAQGKLEADAKALVERLIELEQKGYDASLALDELAKERDIVFTGTTADAIAGGIINGFKAGKKTAADFADDFGGLMEDALLSAFKSQYLDGAIDDFYKEFAKVSADGLDDAEIEALRARYADIIANGSGLSEAIKKIRGEITEGLDEGFKTSAFSLLLQSAEETGKSIEQILKDSILEGLKAQIFTDALKPLQAKIALLYKDGKIPTKEELASITAEYTAFIDGAKAKLKEVEDNTGLVFNDKIAEDLRAAAEKIKSEIQSISDSILDVFANSDNALQDFESKFNGMVKNTILKSLQETTLQGRLTEFYTEFQKLSNVSDGEKEAQVAKLRAQYNAIIKEGKDEYERLQDVFGVDYGSSAAKPSAAIGEGVQRITEDTANAIAGPIIGTFEQATKIANLMGKHYAIATQALDMAVKTEANTRRGANAGENALPLLNEIARNTRPKQGSSLSDSYSKI